MVEPPLKKLKDMACGDHELATDLQNDSVFRKFRLNERAMFKLDRAFNALLYGNSGLNLRFLKIRETDACSARCFSQATCDCQADLHDTETIFTAGSIFEIGLDVLKEFLKENGARIPAEKNCRVALKKLLVFLSSDDYTQLTTPMEGFKSDECEWSLRLAQHLLSKLAVESKYTIDDFNYHNIELKNAYSENFGNTSLGVPDAWHGYIDILMQVPVTMRKQRDDELDSVSNSSVTSSTEDKSGKHFQSPDVNQMLAQTIVFSFLQKKECSSLNNYLIPSLGISTDRLKVHFYDCVDDVLLESDQLLLFDGSNPVVNTVVFLWLSLNYRHFCSGLTEKMKQLKSSFHSCVRDFLQHYQNDVHRPYVFKKQTFDGRDKWSEHAGIPGKVKSSLNYVNIE